MERSVRDWGGVIAAFILVIIINGMANGVPLGGQTTGEISAKYPTLFTPAGFTFGIRGLIYTLLTCFVVYQALPAQRNDRQIAAISQLFIANCLANAAWIFVWHYDLLWLSLLLMVCLLVTLVAIYRTLDRSGPPQSRTEWLFVRAPFSLYVGWITVATLANFSVLQTAMGWNDLGLSELDWTFLKLAIAGAAGNGHNRSNNTSLSGEYPYCMR